MEDYKKKYEYALNAARKFKDDCPLFWNTKSNPFKDVFEELKESEDERIRKDLIGYFEVYDNKTFAHHRVSDIIAWLEKQCKPQVRTGIEWVNRIDDACNNRYAEEYAHGEYCHEQSFRWGFQEGVDWLEKQGGKNFIKQKLLDYPYVPGWRENRPNNKPQITHSVLMFTKHGVAEGEWLGEEWCQYRWSCKIKDTEVLYWLNLSDLETLEKENVK